jgi:hypothetical protein
MAGAVAAVAPKVLAAPEPTFTGWTVINGNYSGGLLLERDPPFREDALHSSLSQEASQIRVKSDNYQVGDRIYLERDGMIEFMQINSGTWGEGPFRFSVIRNLDGAGAKEWPEGTRIVNIR